LDLSKGQSPHTLQHSLPLRRSRAPRDRRSSAPTTQSAHLSPVRRSTCARARAAAAARPREAAKPFSSAPTRRCITTAARRRRAQAESMQGSMRRSTAPTGLPGGGALIVLGSLRRPVQSRLPSARRRAKPAPPTQCMARPRPCSRHPGCICMPASRRMLRTAQAQHGRHGQREGRTLSGNACWPPRRHRPALPEAPTLIDGSGDEQMLSRGRRAAQRCLWPEGWCCVVPRRRCAAASPPCKCGPAPGEVRGRHAVGGCPADRAARAIRSPAVPTQPPSANCRRGRPSLRLLDCMASSGAPPRRRGSPARHARHGRTLASASSTPFEQRCRVVSTSAATFDPRAALETRKECPDLLAVAPVEPL
jgi:hypothetical protein